MPRYHQKLSSCRAIVANSAGLNRSEKFESDCHGVRGNGFPAASRVGGLVTCDMEIVFQFLAIVFDRALDSAAEIDAGGPAQIPADARRVAVVASDIDALQL